MRAGLAFIFDISRHTVSTGATDDVTILHGLRLATDDGSDCDVSQIWWLSFFLLVQC